VISALFLAFVIFLAGFMGILEQNTKSVVNSLSEQQQPYYRHARLNLFIITLERALLLSVCVFLD
jgi:archaellum component FlaG (FlaF/FlaG flagellin family)